MKVSWNWLSDYLDLKMPPDEVAHRLAMAGLNHESSQPVGDDLMIDLEVTSNRSDCLGHLGIAREIATLWRQDLRLPTPALPVASASSRPATPASELVSVDIECPDLCPRYIARVIRGVKIGPSPEWLANRLRTIGLAVINNVVDVTNYVMMECGQPLHAFDLRQLRGSRIIVRRALPDEQFTAIDHKVYALSPQMCVIADGQRAVALAGVMGGVDSEVSDATVDLLIEAADFNPLSVRSTARRLHRPDTPSSYRFTRRVDPAGIDWASRRACQLILELAGGELAAGSVDCVVPGHHATPIHPEITLRWSQLPRILGIDPPRDTVRDILRRLGLEVLQDQPQGLTLRAPSWRRDLTREVDLIEEVARIHGYDQIPEDARVPMTASQRTQADRVLSRVRQAMTAGGFDEALTPSVVDQPTSDAYSPWCSSPALHALTPLLRGADRLRRSLIPSLLAARLTNQSRSNAWIELFETAKIYLPRTGQLPSEPWMLGLTSGRDFLAVKGILQGLVRALGIHAPLVGIPIEDAFYAEDQGVQLTLNGQTVGVLGTLSATALKDFQLRAATVVAELQLEPLIELADLVPQARPLSHFPAVEFDLNFIVEERLRWSDLSSTVTTAAGPEMESLIYRETYRDPKKDGAGKKRILLTVVLRAADRTLTGDESERVRLRVVEACRVRHGAELLLS
ncbi:MAG: phenylalanine--tRNA ligase subunit beta [Pirellulales bacterium]